MWEDVKSCNISDFSLKILRVVQKSDNILIIIVYNLFSEREEVCYEKVVVGFDDYDPIAKEQWGFGVSRY